MRITYLKIKFKKTLFWVFFREVFVYKRASFVRNLFFENLGMIFGRGGFV